MGMLVFLLIVFGLTVVPLVALGVLWTYCCKQEQEEQIK